MLGQEYILCFIINFTNLFHLFAHHDELRSFISFPTFKHHVLIHSSIMQILILSLLLVSQVSSFNFKLSQVKKTNNINSISLNALTTQSSSSAQTSSSNPSPYDPKAFSSLFQSCIDEVCESLPGTFPTDIEGTFFRNIMGKFEAGKEKYTHPFDADGMIAAIQFKDGKAIFRNRMIATKAYLAQKKAKKIVYRGFGTQKKGGIFANLFDTNLKNAANTNIIHWGGQLLALWEGGLPHRMEADSLRTLGETKVRNLLSQNQPFSAHPRVDANTNRFINFSVKNGGGGCKMKIYEFNSKFNVQSNRYVCITIH